LYNFEFSVDSDIFFSFLYGLRQDASVTGYFTVIPGLLLAASVFLSPVIIRYFIDAYTGILLFVTGFIIVADAELYRNWGFRTDAAPLLYLKQPSYAAASADTLTIVILVLISLLLFAFMFFSYIKILRPVYKKIKPAGYKTFAVVLLFTGLMILPIRGSLGIAPMNTGTVYFSEKNVFANHAALNVIWNVGYSLTKLDKFKKITFFDDAEAKNIFKKLYPETKQTSRMLKTGKPNVLIIILESFTAKVCGAFGGIKGITPNLDKLAENGIIFENFYASGDRTVKGIVAILSAYPSLPTTAVMKYSSKVEKLPVLTGKFKEAGYNTEWVCGFDVNFANINSYIIHNNFDKVITVDSFPGSYGNSKWGIHDHIVFEKLAEECRKSKKPYFKVFMTLSSHEPFDVPAETVIKGDDEDSRFLNSVAYTDNAIGNFVKAMKTSGEWENTLIIFVADHGSRLPNNTLYYTPERFKIPMVWTGGAVKKNTVISKYAGQTDIPATLSSQLGIPHKEFMFGKDILSPESESFAFYDFNNGFGFITDTSVCVFDNNRRDYILNKGNCGNNFGKAYMQILTNDFVFK